MLILFFFFKQKTAYEMRISDWSSDVCSSDLLLAGQPAGTVARAAGADPGAGAAGRAGHRQADDRAAAHRRRRAVGAGGRRRPGLPALGLDRKSTRLNSSH